MQVQLKNLWKIDSLTSFSFIFSTIMSTFKILVIFMFKIDRWYSAKISWVWPHFKNMNVYTSGVLILFWSDQEESEIFERGWPRTASEGSLTLFLTWGDFDWPHNKFVEKLSLCPKIKELQFENLTTFSDSQNFIPYHICFSQ